MLENYSHTPTLLNVSLRTDIIVFRTGSKNAKDSRIKKAKEHSEYNSKKLTAAVMTSIG